MSNLTARISDLAIRLATECKSIRTLVNGNAADLSSLTTTQKTSLVAAINELKTAISSIGATLVINDSATNSTELWSSTKIAAAITQAKSDLVNDANFASTVTTGLSFRLRFDTAQTLTAGQKTQACANLGIGEPDTDFVTTFNSGLV